MFKDRYEEAREELSYVVIQRILANKTRQSNRRYANLMDWTTFYNTSHRHGPANEITFQMPQEARVWIGPGGVLTAGYFADGKDGTEQPEEEGDGNADASQTKPKPPLELLLCLLELPPAEWIAEHTYNLGCGFSLRCSVGPAGPGLLVRPIILCILISSSQHPSRETPFSSLSAHQRIELESMYCT